LWSFTRMVSQKWSAQFLDDFMESVRVKDIRQVRIGIRFGIDVNMYCKKGKTALIEACGTKWNDWVVKALIKAKANVNQHDHEGKGRTPLLAACARNVGFQTVQRLVRAKADVCATDLPSHNKTALHYIAWFDDELWPQGEKERVAQADYLLVHGALSCLTICERDHNETPSEFAVRRGHRKLGAFYKQQEAVLRKALVTEVSFLVTVAPLVSIIVDYVHAF